MGKISAVYKITNNVTGDFYIGSSVNVMKRWREHKRPGECRRKPNNKMYQDIQEYGLDCFSFEILEEVEPENLKQVEQKFIEMLKPTYNTNNAKGLNVEKHKETQKKYFQSEKGKASWKKSTNMYLNQICEYNGETLTLNALRMRFSYAGISHPTLEAKKYLTNNGDKLEIRKEKIHK